MGEFQDKTKGKAKEVAGVATGNRSLEAEGKADQTKSWFKQRFEALKARWRGQTNEPGRPQP